MAYTQKRGKDYYVYVKTPDATNPDGFRYQCPTKDPAHHQATPGWTSRSTRSLTGRRAIITGIAFWAAALIELVFYVNDIGPRNAVDFALFEIWMLGSGCGASPILTVRGRRLAGRTCLTLGFRSFACALLLAFRRLAHDEPWIAAPEIRTSGTNGHRVPGSWFVKTTQTAAIVGARS